jgi:hypothetical protein
VNGATIVGNLYTGATGFAWHTGWLQPIMSACTSHGIVVLGAPDWTVPS